ncbi:WAT1-related protein At1g25270-like isoform X2 [Prunus dulcis]|uniref:WAT1-related protein At1g25270-like isoform X2 n=1 Tax=Prunus dulcis TaxID=3755 RepID=UPI001481EB2B|nr:WAT1-related protein At1g25270-like isoform X2 [Prunus dulcis]
MGVHEICDALHDMKPVLLMVAVQFSFAGVNIFYKLATNDGMSSRILVAYRFIFGTAFLLPIALIFERKSRPKLTWMVLLQGFLSGLFGGSLSQNLYIQSLALTSATFASAIAQLIPALTFVFAVTCRLESLNLRSIAGKAKVLGTLMGIGGAMVLTFYKGVEINIWSTHVDLLHGSQQQNNHLAASAHADSGNRLLGCLLSLGSCFGFALWLIIQTKMGATYPCYYSSSALMSAMGSIQAVGFALIKERDWSQWKLGSCGHWAKCDMYCFVHTHERPLVCICFQPSYAGACCHCWVSGIGREAAPWKCVRSSIDSVRLICCAVG